MADARTSRVRERRSLLRLGLLSFYIYFPSGPVYGLWRTLSLSPAPRYRAQSNRRFYRGRSLTLHRARSRHAMNAAEGSKQSPHPASQDRTCIGAERCSLHPPSLGLARPCWGRSAARHAPGAHATPRTQQRAEPVTMRQHPGPRLVTMRPAHHVRCTMYPQRMRERPRESGTAPIARLVDPTPRIVHSRVHARSYRMHPPIRMHPQIHHVHLPSHGHIMGPSSGDTPARRILACVTPVINGNTHPPERPHTLARTYEQILRKSNQLTSESVPLPARLSRLLRATYKAGNGTWPPLLPLLLPALLPSLLLPAPRRSLRLPPLSLSRSLPRGRCW